MATRMTPALAAQVEACVRLIREGYNSQDLREIGYAEAAIREAMKRERGK